LIVTKHEGLALKGTPSYQNIVHKLMIFSTAILAAVNSEPNVVLSTMTCHFEYQSINV
jgi:hypothetical protein